MGDWIDGAITRIDRLGGDVSAFEIASADGCALPPFEAGSHVEVLIRPNLVRPYSLCGSPSRTDAYRIGVLRDAASRGGSEVICRQWAVGDRVRISAPRNLFPLVPEAMEAILVAGGVGATPLVAMALGLAERGADFTLHYCVSTPDRAAFLPELVASGLGPHVRPHFSRDRRFDVATDVGPPREDAHIYVCGPSGFIDTVVADARAAGWREDRVHVERFDADTDLSGGPFTVRLAGGEAVEIPPGASIAQVLIALGHDIEVSCEKGICGSCITTVTAGVPDHRDHYLTDEERRRNDRMALCCSRALTPEIALEL